MTTAAHHETVTAIAATKPNRDLFANLPPITFEMRLELTQAAMDALLNVPEETQDALSAALKEADGLAVTSILNGRQRSTQRPELFQPNQILKAAGDLIRTRGWTKGVYDDARGQLCAMGAIRVATRGDGWFVRPESAGERDAVLLLLDRIADAFGPGLSVPGWNDRQDSAEDVLKLLF